MPAFMNQPQYQQQMQGLAMQVRQQEEGTKKIKKFLKAYEDIQLSAPMAPQQPGFMGGGMQQQPQQPMMQPPGGAVRAGNNNIPRNDMSEPAPESFTAMAGGSVPSEGEDNMVSYSGADEEMSTPSSSDGEEWDGGFSLQDPKPGSPGDPGLSKKGQLADYGNTQAARKIKNTEKMIAGKDAAFDRTVKESGWKGMPIWIDTLGKWLKDAKAKLSSAKEAPVSSSVVNSSLKKEIKSLQQDLKTAKKLDKDVAAKLKKIASSTPNKAMGLAGLGAGLLAGTGQASATAFPPEDAEVFFGRMNADKDFNRLNAREKAAVQKYLEYKAESDAIDARVDVPRGRSGQRDKEPIEYTSAEKVMRSQ